MLKQSSSKNKKILPIVQPHSEKSPVTKKADGTVPSSFPGEASGLKKSLSSFKIPKRKAAVDSTRSPASSSSSSSSSSPPEKHLAARPVVKIPALDISEATAGVDPQSEHKTEKPLQNIAVSSQNAPTPKVTSAQEEILIPTGSVTAAVSKPISHPTTSTPPLTISTPSTSVTKTATSADVKGTKKSVPKIPKITPQPKLKKSVSLKPPEAVSGGNKPKDLSSLLLSLNPDILQTLAATIQRTLQVVQ